MGQRMQTRINREYLEEVIWTLQWSSLNRLHERLRGKAKAAHAHLYGTSRTRHSPTLATVDAFYMVLVERYQELALPVPDDLWERLLVHEWLEEDTAGTPTEAA